MIIGWRGGLSLWAGEEYAFQVLIVKRGRSIRRSGILSDKEFQEAEMMRISLRYGDAGLYIHRRSIDKMK